MKLPTFAKALVAGVVSAAAPAVTSALAVGGITSKAGLLSAVFAVVGGAATYGVPNGKRPDLAGLVVTVKTDADVFVRQFAAGLPALVGSSLEAALKRPTSAVTAEPSSAPVAVLGNGTAGSTLAAANAALTVPFTGPVTSPPVSTMTVPQAVAPVPVPDGGAALAATTPVQAPAAPAAPVG